MSSSTPCVTYRPDAHVDWMMRVASGSTVLIIGCSAPDLLVRMARHGARVHAIDPDPHRVDTAREICRDALPDTGHLVDITRAQLDGFAPEPEAYDSVVLLDEIATASIPKEVLSRATEALKSDGTLAVLTVWGHLAQDQRRHGFFLHTLPFMLSDALHITALELEAGHIRLTARKQPGSCTLASDVRAADLMALLAQSEQTAQHHQVLLNAALGKRTRQVRDAWEIIDDLKQQLMAIRQHMPSSHDPQTASAGHTLPQRPDGQKDPRQQKRTLRYRLQKKWRKLRTRFRGTPNLDDLINQTRSTSDQPLTESDLAFGSEGAGYLMICNAYPGKDKGYGGEFIKARTTSYLAAGQPGLIVELNDRNTSILQEQDGPLTVLRAPLFATEAIVRRLATLQAQVLVHSPFPALVDQLMKHVEPTRLTVWFHGADIRDPRRLYFNFTTDARERNRRRLDTFNQARNAQMRALLPSPHIRKVFVSDYLRTIAQRDIDAEIVNATVIHNFIDTDFFTPTERPVGHSRRILLIRPFREGNYAADLAVRAVQLLASRDGFEALDFTLRGFGDSFQELTAPLVDLPNVRLEERYSSRDEIRELHRAHGIFLCPSRHDTQGVSLGEAMASGLACITNDVAAIPQFVDSECGVLVPPNNPVAMADAIWKLAHDPEQVQRLGRAATRRVHMQCGFDQTIGQELQLIQPRAEPR